MAWTDDEQKLAKSIFEVIAFDPDWDDAPYTDADRVSEDDDPSQEFCLRWARRILTEWNLA